MMKHPKPVRDAISGWLWWATWTVRRASGSGTVAAFKAAQAATAKLYA